MGKIFLYTNRPNLDYLRETHDGINAWEGSSPHFNKSHESTMFEVDEEDLRPIGNKAYFVSNKKAKVRFIDLRIEENRTYKEIVQLGLLGLGKE